MTDLLKGMTMEKVIYLHIGTSKTGTTSIQNFLYRNRKLLASKGYSFKQMPMRYDRADRNRNAMFLASHRLTLIGSPTKQQQEKILNIGLANIKAQLKHHKAVILTDESLWNSFQNKNRKGLRRLKAFADNNNAALKIIVYFRPQEDWLESSYRQHVKKYKNSNKKNRTLPWDAYINDPAQWPNADYYTSLSRLAEVVGKDNIIVRIYDRKSFIGGMIENDFLQAVGLKPSEEYEMLEAERNTSLSANFIEVKRILDRLDGTGSITDKELISAESAAINCSARFSSSGGETFITPEQRAFIRAHFREGNEKIAKEYLKDRTELFPEPKEKPVWNRDNPDLYEDTVLLLGHLILEKEREINRLKKTVYLRLKIYDKCKALFDKMVQLFMRETP